MIESGGPVNETANQVAHTFAPWVADLGLELRSTSHSHAHQHLSDNDAL